jgi:hypothetical protein
MNLLKREDAKNPPQHPKTQNFVSRSKDPQSPNQLNPKLKIKIPKSLPKDETTKKDSDQSNPTNPPNVTAMGILKKMIAQSPTAHSKGYEKKPSIFYQKDIAENLRKNLHLKAKLPSRKFIKPAANIKSFDDENLMVNREEAPPVDKKKFLLKDSPCFVNSPLKLRIVRPGHGCFIIEPLKDDADSVELRSSMSE